MFLDGNRRAQRSQMLIEIRQSFGGVADRQGTPKLQCPFLVVVPPVVGQKVSERSFPILQQHVHERCRGQRDLPTFEERFFVCVGLVEQRRALDEVALFRRQVADVRQLDREPRDVVGLKGSNRCFRGIDFQRPDIQLFRQL